MECISCKYCTHIRGEGITPLFREIITICGNLESGRDRIDILDEACDKYERIGDD